MTNRNPLSGIFWSSDHQRQVLDTDFTPAFAAGPVTVGAQQLAGGVDIAVGARSPATPGLGNYTWISDGVGHPFNRVAQVQPGTEPILSLPPGVNLQSGSSLVPGAQFQFLGQGVTITSVVPRPGLDILLYLQIAPDAPFGPRPLQVTTPDGTALMSGGLVVVPPPPVIHSVTLTSSPSGTTAVIDGENFASTSLPIVLFDGEMSTSLTVESATRLRVTVPPGAEKAADIRVITPSGVARA
jgi:IPT/TIG domain-containing protein